MLPVRWLPPEAFTDGKFTVYSDIYSYGVLLWELFTFAKLPYEDYDNSKTMELILDVSGQLQVKRNIRVLKTDRQTDRRTIRHCSESECKYRKT